MALTSPLRPISRTHCKDWHPAWFVPGARCRPDFHGWVGTVLGFQDGPVGEFGVIRTEEGTIIRTVLTQELYPVVASPKL